MAESFIQVFDLIGMIATWVLHAFHRTVPELGI
jgi:hypothetical protein